MKTDNELIAEFMGLIRREANSTYNLPQYYKFDKTKHANKGSFVGYPHQLKYDTSWDWLMPVVEKIECISYPTENDMISKHEILLSDIASKVLMLGISTPINIVYRAVLEFIKWHSSK